MGKAQIVASYLFVNDIYDDPDETSEFGAIYVYDFDFEATSLNLEIILNADFFGESEQFEVRSFDVAKVAQANIVRVLVGDAYMKIISADIPEKESGVLDFANAYLKKVDLRNFLNQQSLFVTNSSELLDILIIDQNQITLKDLTTSDQYYTLALINDTATYELIITVKNDQVDPTISLAVDQAFNNYGDYTPQKTAKSFGNVTTVAYYNDNENSTILAFYFRNRVKGPLHENYREEEEEEVLTVKDGNMPNDQYTIINPIIGACKFDYDLAFEEVYNYELYEDKNQNVYAVVVNPYDNSLLQLAIRQKMIVNITSTNIQKQDITIIAQSDYAESTDKFGFTLYHQSNPSKSKKKSLWWISLIVVGAVLIAAGIIVFIKKRNRSIVKDNSEFISLQETKKA